MKKIKYFHSFFIGYFQCVLDSSNGQYALYVTSGAKAPKGAAEKLSAAPFAHFIKLTARTPVIAPATAPSNSSTRNSQLNVMLAAMALNRK